MNGHWVAIILGLVITIFGFSYRKYITKNANDFDEPLGKLYGKAMIFIVVGIFLIIFVIVVQLNKILE